MKFLSSAKVLFAVAIFVFGMVSLAGVNGFFALTNEMEFCTSCHSMKVNLEEYQETAHFKSASGVQATCADCHVPKQFFPKVMAKMLAAKDVYHEIMGTVDTPEKYEAHRWQMASAVWDRMKANNSRECRTCHAFENMDLSAQGRSARNKHPRGMEEGKTCIDCHKGIAHTLPDEPEEPEQPAAEAATEKAASAG
jgi:cytochrome c-type protein NapC